MLRITIPLGQITAHLCIILIAGHRMRYDAGHIKDSVSRCLETIFSKRWAILTMVVLGGVLMLIPRVSSICCIPPLFGYILLMMLVCRRVLLRSSTSQKRTWATSVSWRRPTADRAVIFVKMVVMIPYRRHLNSLESLVSLLLIFKSMRIHYKVPWLSQHLGSWDIQLAVRIQVKWRFLQRGAILVVCTSFERSCYFLPSSYISVEWFSLLLLSCARHLVWHWWRRNKRKRLILLLCLQLLLSRLLRQSLLESSLLDVPIVHEIKVIPLTDEGFPEHRNKLLVIRLLLELQLPRIV